MSAAGAGGGTALVVRVPMVPPKELWPNRRASGWAKTGPTRALRLAAYHAARNELGPRMTDPWWCFQTAPGPILLDLTIAWPKGQRRLDDDSAIAACKAARDGIADAIGTDDRRFRVASMAQTWDRQGAGYVEFVLSAAPAGGRDGGEGER